MSGGSIDDPYSWVVLPEKRHLFTKNISDHSTGAYKELCDGVGKTFEATSAQSQASGHEAEMQRVNLGVSNLIFHMGDY